MHRRSQQLKKALLRSSTKKQSIIEAMEKHLRKHLREETTCEFAPHCVVLYYHLILDPLTLQIRACSTHYGNGFNRVDL